MISEITSEGWMALCVSIIKEVAPSEAFKLLREPVKHKVWTDSEMLEIGKMRENGDSWKDISNTYSVDIETVRGAYHRWRYRRKVEREKS